MDKKSIISLIVVLMGITGLVVWSKSVERSEPSARAEEKSHPARVNGPLVLSENFYDFGSISMRNGDVSKIFTVTNTGAEDVVLPDLFTSCMCTNAFILNKDGTKKGPFGMPGHGGFVAKANLAIKAGESVDIEAVYNPNAHGPAGVGLIERSVILQDQNRNTVEFKFKANVRP